MPIDFLTQKERERNKSADVLRGGNKKIKTEKELLDYSTPCWNNRPSVRPPTQQQEQEQDEPCLCRLFFQKHLYLLVDTLPRSAAAATAAAAAAVVALAV
jgi:hypothetical protein